MSKLQTILLFLVFSSISGCASQSQLASSGPSADQISITSAQLDSPIHVVDLTPDVAKRASSQRGLMSFGKEFTQAKPASYRIGKGDALEVMMWEAPPAALFVSGQQEAQGGAKLVLPAQTVEESGEITVPFVGRLAVAGKTTKAIEDEILSGLRGKANKPQVMVRVTQNSSFDVTIVGDVAKSARVPLTSRGERLLDVIAAAGGVKDASGKVTVQISRGATVESVPLDRVIRDPGQNVIMLPGDVVTIHSRPNSLTALGATGRNEEVAFEATGLSLAQALGRVGGVIDNRALASGVFVFRKEDPAIVPPKSSDHLVDGKTPVIYRIDLRDPASFLVMQDFQVSDRDVLYVANAPAAELQKFMGVIGSIIYPIASMNNLVRQ